MTQEELFSEIPILETEHYLLRGLTENDASETFVFHSDKRTMKYITHAPVESEDAMRNEIRTQLNSFSKQKEIPWVIINKSDGDLIGTFSLYKLSMWHKKAEMGVVIRTDYQNKGVMSEVLEQVLSFGFDTLGLNRIVGDIFADNHASKRLLEKFGFRKEGVLRQTDFDGVNYHDTVVYSLLRANRMMPDKR